MQKQITLSEYEHIFVGTEDDRHNGAVDEKTFSELESFVLQNSESVQYLKLGQNRQGKFGCRAHVSSKLEGNYWYSIFIFEQVKRGVPGIKLEHA